MKPGYKTRLLQNRAEHDAFIGLLKAEGVRSYLEIGLGWGGSLWRVGNSLPKGSRIVGLTIDPYQDQTRQEFDEAVASFRARGYDAHLIIGDSTNPVTVDRARALAPFDCVFIDGNHSLAGVTKDWDNYGPFGRMIAFHDIAWNSTWKSKVPGRVTQPMGVPELWAELKPQYRHREIRLHSKGNYYGIGVLWRESTSIMFRVENPDDPDHYVMVRRVDKFA